MVQNDWTVRWRNRFLQLPRSTAKTVQPGTRVMVCEQLDGRQRLFYGKDEFAWSSTRSEPVRQRKQPAKACGKFAQTKDENQRPLIHGDEHA